MRNASPRLAAAALTALLAAGCASTGDEAAPADLDVPMSAGETVATGKAGAGGDATIPDAAVSQWQAFFKAPPNAKERSQLEQKLAKWTDTSTPDGLVAKARAELALGRLAPAEASLREALRLSDGHLGALLELASVSLRKSDVTATFELLAQIKEGIATSDSVSQSFIFRYRYTLALGYLARGERDKGHKVLSDLIGVEKAFAPAYAALAGSYLAAGRDNVAEFVLRRGLDRAKDDANLLTMMGIIEQHKRAFESARTYYNRALAAKPGFAPALVNRAALSAANLEYGAAEEDLTVALQNDPMSVEAFVALGIVQRRQGNVNGARASFNKALEVDPNDALARFNLGVLLVDDFKKPTEALRLFHEVLATESSSLALRETARNYVEELRRSGTSL
jgi:tetratricopeptide (TPR) repeat protein